MTHPLNFKQTADLIAEVGKKLTVLVRGETGIGKSSIGSYLQATRFTDHDLVVVDVTTMTEGDVGLPWKATVNGMDITVFAPNEFFGLHSPKPRIIVLDELPKGSKGVVDMLMPLLLERRFGVKKLHADDVVFGTGNLSWEMLGDNFMPHQLNRIMDITMRKPRVIDEDTQQPVEWLKDFAIPNQCPPSGVAFLMEQGGRLFADYTPAQASNPYIHKPGHVSGQFVTPRSMWKMLTEHLPVYGRVDSDTYYAGMVGLVGEACAKDFQVFLNMEIHLPAFADAANDPLNCRIPSSPVECMMMVYRVAQNVKVQNLGNIVTYVKRFPGELRALFTEIVTTQPHTMALTPHLYPMGMIADNQDLRTA